MSRHILTASAALALLLSGTVSHAAAATGADPLPALFVEYFFNWKSQPRDLRVSKLRVLNTGGALRVLCGAYALPGQDSRPFLVMGDASPSAAAAWEPGSFPESDPLYPRLMDNLRLCQTLGAEVTTAQWGGGRAARPAA
jgi:hypothetical protein